MSVHIEVKPKYLIPDTNCFIDYLDQLKTLAATQVYTLMVPLVGKYHFPGFIRKNKNDFGLNSINELNEEDLIKSRKEVIKCNPRKRKV